MERSCRTCITFLILKKVASFPSIPKISGIQDLKAKAMLRVSGSKFQVIIPATKYNKNNHSREGGYPRKYWMPDQVRQDGVNLLYYLVNKNSLFQTVAL